MKRAEAPIVGEVAASRQDLGRQHMILLALHPAEIRSLPVADQCLEQRLPTSTADLGFEVATAGRANPVIGGLAARRCTGVVAAGNRQGTTGFTGQGQSPGHEALAIDDDKPVPAKAARRGRTPRSRDLARKAVRRAANGVSLTAFQMAAGDVERGLTPEFVVLLEGRPEREPFGMPEQPRSVVIGIVLVESGDTKRQVQGVALATEMAARRGGHGTP